ncbi:hypothetical protein KM043_005579 [Ampulex compressa]|nr:hypothetical protein KM043_005579 [Ampulex compressa]
MPDTSSKPEAPLKASSRPSIQLFQACPSARSRAILAHVIFEGIRCAVAPQLAEVSVTKHTGGLTANWLPEPGREEKRHRLDGSFRYRLDSRRPLGDSDPEARSTWPFYAWGC